MEQRPATSAPGPDHPAQPEQRTCRVCNETKAVSPETWPYRHKRKHEPYKAYGAVCMACEKKRKAAYEGRRDKIAALVADVPSVPHSGNADDKGKQRDAVKQSKLDVAKALKAGARVLNEYAPSVLARVLEYAEDPEHELHQWALDILVNRILPRKLFEELGASAAGVGSLSDKRPQFVIQVLPAQPEHPTGGLTIEGTAETVQVLPAPAEGAT